MQPARRIFPQNMPARSAEMSTLFRGLAAGYGASKLGGGCISTVLIFILLWWLLGQAGC
jgi:hypothetical protein